jgi:hypothetical protein
VEGGFAHFGDFELEADRLLRINIFYEGKGSARRQHLCRVDVRRGKQSRFERVEIYFFDVGNGGDQNACKTGRGRVVDNAGRDDEDNEG